jgi:hypothetical protein
VIDLSEPIAEKLRVNDEMDNDEAAGTVVAAPVVAGLAVVAELAVVAVVAVAAVVAELDELELPQAAAAKPVTNTMEARAGPFLSNKIPP